MRYLISGLLLFTINMNTYANGVNVLAASTTSKSNNSSEAICLLDEQCDGYWEAGAKDDGIDEGIYFQFEEPVLMHTIKVFSKGASDNDAVNYKIYLNGKTTSPDDIVYTMRVDKNNLKNITTSIFEGRNWREYQNSLHTKVKSVFIKIGKNHRNSKIDKPKVTGVAFYKRIATNDKKEVKLERIKFKLPKVIGATIKASSTLSPTTAYQAANLFDSKYDFAWSTDGSKTKGINEVLSIGFTKKLNISGMYVWNGYQRSSTHMRKNGKVKGLSIKSRNEKIEIKLQNKSGLQKIKFKKTLKNVRTLNLEIKSIYAGSKYKDVLISELRLIDDKGNIVLPYINKKNVNIKKQHKKFIDSSWSSFLNDIVDAREECSFGCNYKRIRLRKNGTFVIYRDFQFKSAGEESAEVLEGNWAYDKNKIRIFGKRYSTSLTSSDYMKGIKNNTVPSAKIFQSYLMVKKYLELTKAEKKNLFSYLMKTHVTSKKGAKKIMWGHNTNLIKHDAIVGGNLSEVEMILDKTLKKINPYYIKSSVINDLFLPSSSVSECSEYC